MAYVHPNFKTKKAIKEAVANGQEVKVFSSGPFDCTSFGVETVEGPHYPEPHRWYAQVKVEDYKITKVIS